MPATSTPTAPQSMGKLVRRHDPDRYLCALFAPDAHRETLFTLYAFNHELARACEVTREPGLSLIRLQWWREVVEGEARAHEVAAPLQAAVQAGRLAAGDLLVMIEARETEAEGAFATMAAWTAWLHHGAGAMAVAAARALGAPGEVLAALRARGAGCGAAGQLRNVAALARQGRCLLPADLLAQSGLSPDDVVADPAAPAMAEIRRRLAATGRCLLGPPRRWPRSWLPAALPAVLARRDLARLDAGAAPRGLGDRGAVAAAFALGVG